MTPTRLADLEGRDDTLRWVVDWLRAGHFPTPVYDPLRQEWRINETLAELLEEVMDRARIEVVP